MLSLQDLTIGYAQKANQKVVAAHLNATLHSGKLTCLIGSNGIGKSTLLRTLSAFQPPLCGTILVNRPALSDDELTGTPSPLSSLTPSELSRLIGVVLTEKPQVENLSVFELVGLGRSPYTGFWGNLKEPDKQVVRESLRLVGIEALQHRLIQTLSDGERQKMMIAKALAQQTPIILLDEPTAFLDYPSKVEMLQLLKHLARDTKKAIFLSTHDMELALQIADELWLLSAPEAHPSTENAGIHSTTENVGVHPSTENAGATLSIGTPQELAAKGSLSRFIDRPGLHFDPHTLTIRITTFG